MRPHEATPTIARDGVDPAQRAGTTRTPWWRELALLGVLYGLYDAIRGVISGSTAQAERDGADLFHLEQILHIDPEHWLNNSLQHLAVVAVPASFFYATLHFVVTPSVLIWVHRAHPASYGQARTILAVITGTALIGFWLFPTAPPRLLTGAGFHDTLAVYSNWGWWGDEASVPAPAAAIANQFAAMPSLHLAWAAWCGATVFRLTRRRWLRLVAVSYPVLTALVVLGTGNHYLLDVVAGAALWGAAELVVRRLRRLAPRRRLTGSHLVGAHEVASPFDETCPSLSDGEGRGTGRCPGHARQATWSSRWRAHQPSNDRRGGG